MVKIFSTYTLLSLIGTTGTGTALSYGNTERSSVQVVYTAGTTGTTTIVIEASNATTSTGTYTTLDSSSKAATDNYVVEVDGAYRWLRAKCSAIDSTGSTIAATIVTQGEGY